MLISSTPEGPTPRHPHREGRQGGVEGGAESSSRSGHSEMRHPRNTLRLKGTGGGVLSDCVRPQTPEQHRHTPSLRGGMLRKGRGGGKNTERYREAERGRDRLGEREEEEEGVGGLLMSHLH